MVDPARVRLVQAASQACIDVANHLDEGLADLDAFARRIARLVEGSA